MTIGHTQEIFIVFHHSTKIFLPFVHKSRMKQRDSSVCRNNNMWSHSPSRARAIFYEPVKFFIVWMSITWNFKYLLGKIKRIKELLKYLEYIWLVKIAWNCFWVFFCIFNSLGYFKVIKNFFKRLKPTWIKILD